MDIIFASGNPLQFLDTLGVEWSQLLGQTFSIVAMGALLWYFVLKPVMKASDERRAQIEKGLKDAREAAESLRAAQEQADAKLREGMREAAEILARTKEDAGALVEKARAESQNQAQLLRKQASEQIEQDRAKMRAELRAEIAALVVKTTERVVGEILGEEQRAKLADMAAKKLEESSK